MSYQPWHNEAGFSSKAEYCHITNMCTNYHFDIPISIGMGAIIGVLIGKFLDKRDYFSIKNNKTK